MIEYGGDFASIRSRKLTEDTCKKFNVRVDEGPVIRFPYYSEAGRVVAYKERPQSKEFRWTGKNEDKQLFGQQLFGSGRTIVITEGELDALSVWQARPKWPVVSVPNGAQGAKKALQQQLNYLMGFEEIILMFDSDEAGTAAAEECVSLFPSEKVFLASLGTYKDPSEALVAGDSEAIRQAIWNKRTYTPQSIIDGRELFDLVSTPLHGRDADYPFDDLNTTTGGLRLGELVTITAGSGTGKSTLCGEIAVSLINQGHAIGYIALEESVKRTGLRLMTVAANKPLHLNNEIPEEDLKSAFTDTVGSGLCFLRDGFGSVDPDALLNDIRFLVKSNEVQWIILDHLSILLSGNESSDERKMIDIVMTKLRSFVEDFLAVRGWEYRDAVGLCPYEPTWYTTWVLHAKPIPVYPREPIFKTFHNAGQHLDYVLRGVTDADLARGFVGVVVNSNYSRGEGVVPLDLQRHEALASYVDVPTLVKAMAFRAWDIAAVKRTPWRQARMAVGRAALGVPGLRRFVDQGA